MRRSRQFLERQGYEVKGEVRGCDLVARRGDEPPVIVELKLRFNLPLVLQGIDRLALDRAGLSGGSATRAAGPRAALAPERPEIRKLCRRLGLGLILVGLARLDGRGFGGAGAVPAAPREIAEPCGWWTNSRAAWAMRISAARSACRSSPPIARTPCAARAPWRSRGPMRVGALRAAVEVPGTARILQRNVYGWFNRIERGIYRLTPEGDQA